MQRRTVIASIGAIVGTSVGAAAYSSANVTRGATFSVTTDTGNARIGLTPGSFDGITESGDTLNISIQDLNTGGTFTFGDDTSIETDFAFSIKNNDGGERAMTLAYSNADVTFDVWQQGQDWTDATSVGKTSDAEGVSWTASMDEVVHVIMIVNTANLSSSGDSLDGDLTITAN